YHVDDSCRQIRSGRASPAAAILPTEIPLDVELGRRADVLLDHGNSALLNLELLVEQVLNAEFHAQSVRRIEGVNEVQGVERLLVSVRRAVAPCEEQALTERVVRNRERVRAIIRIEAELQVRHVLRMLRHGPHEVRHVEAHVANLELRITDGHVTREEEGLEEAHAERRQILEPLDLEPRNL